MNADSRFAELKTTGKLPSPSGVAMAVIELCRRDNVGVEEIGRAVRADPALSGRLIKFANSALHGNRRPVVSVPDAVRMVGITTVRQLVLGFSLLGQYRDGVCEVFDYQAFWSRSLAMAIAADALAQGMRCASPEESFTCGLLASIGRLALATLYPREVDELLSMRPVPDAARLAGLERERFATDHNELCAALLEDWHLPRVFIEAVYQHESGEAATLPAGSRARLLCDLLGLAAGIADFCLAEDTGRRQAVPALILAAAKLGLEEEALTSLTAQLVSEWKEWGKILEVPTRDVPPLEQVIEEAAEPPGPAADLVAPAGGEALTILAVDDDRPTLLVLEHLLRGLGYKVLTAHDGKSALATALSARPQIIISDWIMPGMDGINLCKALRQSEEGRQMYFIVLSALEQDDQLVEAFESGVDDYLTKPFTPRVLAARLRAGLRVVRLQEESQRDNENMRRFAAELAVANRRLQQAALTDSLTGLPNRRYGLERLEQEWAATSRNHRPLACLMVDVDSFKEVNDSYGHDLGDALLRHLGAIMRREVRAEDTVCRMGGEEFLIVLSDASLSTAMVLAERVRRSVAQSAFTSGQLTCKVTVSVGVALREPGMQRIEELVKVADNALYAAKDGGRNRVVGPRRAPLASHPGAAAGEVRARG
ncbi:MAG: diguanylate cyclase [Burkholderiales bacterium]|nr:diguanylate cyclase [Burkholderiales bacterium]